MVFFYNFHRANRLLSVLTTDAVDKTINKVMFLIYYHLFISIRNKWIYFTYTLVGLNDLKKNVKTEFLLFFLEDL